MFISISSVYFYIKHTGNTIEIVDGSVVRLYKLRDREVLVNKDHYNSISEFIYVSVSPDKEKICFLGKTPVPIWLYYGIFDKGLVKEIERIGMAANCVWANDSQKIAFNNHTTDVSPVDVYVYDLETKETFNLTKSLQPDDKEGTDNIRFYQNPIWSPDDLEVTAAFTTFDSSGVTTVNLLTGEIKDSF